MTKIKLDKKDREILYQLDGNSRRSDVEIAREVGLSREVVSYRIKNLIKKGIIERFHTIVDVAKLGLISYKVYLQFQNLDEKTEGKIINFFLNHPNFEWIGRCSGTWDMIVGFWAEDIYRFNEIFLDFSYEYGHYIMNKAFTTTLAVPHYRKDYLVGKKRAKMPIAYFGGEPKKVKLDSIDTEILKILTNNARMSTTEIAEHIGRSSRVVGYRIKELKRKKVIQAFRISLNLNKLDLLFFKAFFYLQNITEEKLHKFLSYCGGHPNVGWVILCMGPWDVEIEFEIESLEKFDESMMDIKRKFGDVIKGTQVVIITEDYGGPRYFPDCYGKIDPIYSVRRKK